MWKFSVDQKKFNIKAHVTIEKESPVIQVLQLYLTYTTPSCTERHIDQDPWSVQFYSLNSADLP